MPSNFTLYDNSKGSKAKWRSKVEERLKEAIYFVAEYTADEMEKQKSGETYTKVNPKTGEEVTWIASNNMEYPAERFGWLVEQLKDRDNSHVVWKNEGKAEAYIGKPLNDQEVADYAEGILDDDLRPWKNRALAECQSIIAADLGPKLFTELNQELNSLNVRATTRWDKYL